MKKRKTGGFAYFEQFISILPILGEMTLCMVWKKITLQSNLKFGLFFSLLLVRGDIISV